MAEDFVSDVFLPGATKTNWPVAGSMNNYGPSPDPQDIFP
jgi:hypothetical protein